MHHRYLRRAVRAARASSVGARSGCARAVASDTAPCRSAWKAPSVSKSRSARDIFANPPWMDASSGPLHRDRWFERTPRASFVSTSGISGREIFDGERRRARIRRQHGRDDISDQARQPAAAIHLGSISRDVGAPFRRDAQPRSARLTQNPRRPCARARYRKTRRPRAVHTL